MPRTNKITARVVPENKGAYQDFLNFDERTKSKVSDLLRSFKSEYEKMTLIYVEPIDMMSKLEEIIIQIRCKETIESELRLSLNLNKKKDMSYIYARTLFYRRNKQINDIRVCIGTTENVGGDLDALLRDGAFREICRRELIRVMDKEIEVNINNLKLVEKDEQNI